jgi:hypothetical protein
VHRSHLGCADSVAHSLLLDRIDRSKNHLSTGPLRTFVW